MILEIKMTPEEGKTIDVGPHNDRDIILALLQQVGITLEIRKDDDGCVAYELNVPDFEDESIVGELRAEIDSLNARLADEG